MKKGAYRFLDNSHLDRVVFYLGKRFLLALADHEQGVRMELPPSIIGRLRLLLEQRPEHTRPLLHHTNSIVNKSIHTKQKTNPKPKRKEKNLENNNNTP